MTNFTKWIAIACLAAAAFIGMPALTSAQQNDLGVEDPTAAAPPPEFIAPADVKKMVDTNATIRSQRKPLRRATFLARSTIRGSTK